MTIPTLLGVGTAAGSDPEFRTIDAASFQLSPDCVGHIYFDNQSEIQDEIEISDRAKMKAQKDQKKTRTEIFVGKARDVLCSAEISTTAAALSKQGSS
mmetsp:Transcript_13574/g.38881  ORF Transcript_13574/g.38881 Transcript_13574/m.38881 type:complete len:98 (-) Transcript_13574:85-378(-)